MPKLKEEPQDTKITKETKSEIKIDDTSDVYTPEERKEILQIVRDDVDYGQEVQDTYVAQKVLDLQHYHMKPPSVLEGLSKRPWMADRNLGLARAIADSFQSTYVATTWNPDSINFIATRMNDINNCNNQMKFTKWGMGKQEANFQPEEDAFVHNQVVVGSAFYKIYRKTWEEWVDKRIPVKNKSGKTYKWDIKTEKVKLEKGVIENIPDIDDILMPTYGKDIQELPFFIQRLHLDGERVLDLIKRKVFKPVDKENYKDKLRNHASQDQERDLAKEKADAVGVQDNVTDLDVRRLPITLYEWYGFYTKDGRTEKFRFIVDLENDEFLSGKPLRKINRSGKIPFAGGSIWHEPGQIRGVSTMQIIAPIVNAFNNVFNQKSDFQYVTNCPFGFYKPDEGYTKQKMELEPMIMFPADDPTKINFPNLQRSMAWAESDIRILFEVLERLTGAATYFSIGQQRNKTLGQDMLVEKQSETRFGLGVDRIIAYNCEAIGMWFELYQDYPPKNLAERILGEDGKQIFTNLSIDSLRGHTSVQMTPDIVAGSRAFENQLQMWTFQAGQQMVWLNPQVNPYGNYNLCADTLKKLRGWGDSEVRRYLGEQPKPKFDDAQLDSEWTRFLNGEDFDPPEGETALAIQHLQGHTKQKAEKYQDLDEEYRPNFDAHLFKTTVNVMKFMKNVQKEQIATALAASVAANNQGQPPQPGQNASPGAPQPQEQPLPGALPNEQPPGLPAGGMV